jgi:dTDP-glucose 4,6-dehydratase
LVSYKTLNTSSIPVYGTGNNVRECLYVFDCSEAVLTVIERGVSDEVYNIASGIEKRNIEVVKAILDLLGKSYNLIEFVQDRPGHDYRYAMSLDKIERKLGWKAKTRFEEGLR